MLNDLVVVGTGCCGPRQSWDAVAVKVVSAEEMLVLKVDFCVVVAVAFCVVAAVEGCGDVPLAAYKLLEVVGGGALTFEGQVRGAVVGISE